MRAIAIVLLAACQRNEHGSIVPPGDEELVLKLDGKGVQTYKCVDGAWSFVEPVAMLYQGVDKVGSHGAGPAWHYRDGSGVTGKKVVEEIHDPGSIPWLRLDAASHDGAPGVLHDVDSIQRIATQGGLAPDAPCTSGASLDVPYRARYLFWRTRVTAGSSTSR